ncbi:MAG TPA: hypothetical protein VFR07_18940 [Mycobacteriales bacterium]|nr:hypothetical protein [Mycobacteriales bacterium]
MDLYALAPEDFTRVRDEQVKAARAAKDRARAAELAALRRPTASAYALNALVREEPVLLEQLVELGQALAQAQGGRDAGQLRELGEQRRALVEAVAGRAEVAAGRALGPGPRAEVVATLEAALADPASGQAVRSGRLVRALSYAGFGEVDLDGAVGAAAPEGPTATAGASASQTSAEQDRRRKAEARRAAAQRAALEAAGALDDAVQAASRAEADRAARQETTEHAARQVLAAEQQLRDARQEREDSEQALRRATRELERAHDGVRAAQKAAERARAALDRLASD